MWMYYLKIVMNFRGLCRSLDEAPHYVHLMRQVMNVMLFAHLQSSRLSSPRLKTHLSLIAELSDVTDGTSRPFSKGTTLRSQKGPVDMERGEYPEMKQAAN